MVIFDDVGSEFIIPLIKEYSYTIMPVRYHKIKKINLSLLVLGKMLNNIFKSSLKINYLAALIEIIDPKIVPIIVIFFLLGATG